MAKRKPRANNPNVLPKSAYRLPSGNYVVERSWGPPNRRGRRLRITAVHRGQPDANKLAQVLLDIVTQQMLERDQRESTDQQPKIEK